MRVNQATLPADQPVESHHQSEGQACDANEDDAKEYVLHVLTTTAPLVGSELQSNSDNRWPCIVKKVTPSGSNIVSRRRAPTGPLKSPSGGPTGKCEVVHICGLRFLSHGLSTDKWTSHGGFLALPQSTHPAALCAAQLILCVPRTARATAARCYGAPTSSKAIGANGHEPCGPRRGSKVLRRTRRHARRQNEPFQQFVVDA